MTKLKQSIPIGVCWNLNILQPTPPPVVDTRTFHVTVNRCAQLDATCHEYVSVHARNESNIRTALDNLLSHMSSIMKDGDADVANSNAGISEGPRCWLVGHCILHTLEGVKLNQLRNKFLRMLKVTFHKRCVDRLRRRRSPRASYKRC